MDSLQVRSEFHFFLNLLCKYEIISPPPPPPPHSPYDDNELNDVGINVIVIHNLTYKNSVVYILVYWDCPTKASPLGSRKCITNRKWERKYKFQK